MATSGIVCIRFIIQNTYSARFLPIICQNVTSKSKEIRRHICEFLDQLLHTWPTHALEKHITILGEAIKKVRRVGGRMRMYCNDISNATSLTIRMKVHSRDDDNDSGNCRCRLRSSVYRSEGVLGIRGPLQGAGRQFAS